MTKKKVLLGFMLLIAMLNSAWSQSNLLGLGNFEEPKGDWFEAGGAKLNESDGNKLTALEGDGVFINGEKGRIINLISKETFGDIQLELEFMVPKGSNSGVYLQGRYEIQILDSWEKENPGSGDCGGIYARYDGTRTYGGIPPLANASKEPGEWQHLLIKFNAPRFNSRGEKIKNAVFKKVELNGTTVHKNVEVTGPTASSLDEKEEPFGPLMLQGDHGPVAYRKIVLKKR